MANVEDPRQAVLSASWVSASLILIKGTSIIPIFGWETEGKEKNHSARMNQHLKPGTPGPEATLSLMLVFTHTHTHKTRYSRSWAHTLTDVSIHTHTHTHTHTPQFILWLGDGESAASHFSRLREGAKILKASGNCQLSWGFTYYLMSHLAYFLLGTYHRLIVSLFIYWPSPITRLQVHEEGTTSCLCFLYA